ncbi:MAG TPA: NAD(P)-dependent alcohol dehydrogenase [Bryobacteraceae bacterium]|nr:NAD(P)-dependent alcohol dehydrogenase [Bryobacteraceae bacterium]
MQKRWIDAAVLREPSRPMAIEHLELEGPREDEALVRLVASGICHTDISFWRSGCSGPVVLGHEGAGVIEALGSKVAGFRRGDHVVLSYQSCGQCRACKAGRSYACRRFWDLNFGFARFDGSNALNASGVSGHFFGQSSFATHALATARNMVKVSKKLPLHLLAPLGCGLQTGAGTVLNSLAVKAHSSICIFGAGSVGLAAVMAARIAGADPIIAVDIRPKRLRLARELGATHAFDAPRSDPARRIVAIAGGYDYAVETSGDPHIERIAYAYLNPGGHLALLTGASADDDLPGGRKASSVIQGDAVPQEFIPRLLGFWKDGRFPFDRLVTFYEFARINRAIADSERGSTVKPVLRIADG